MARSGRRGFLGRVAIWLLAAAAAGCLLCMASLGALKVIDPPLTALHVQRRLESRWKSRPYVKRYTPVPLDRISADLRRAVIAAEDGRFYRHHGIDFQEVERVVEDAREGGRLRGASTITQQLVKNLYFGGYRSPVGKAAEWALATPAAGAAC